MRCRWAAALILGLMTAVTAVAPADAAATAEAPKVPAVAGMRAAGRTTAHRVLVPLDHDDPGGARDPDLASSGFRPATRPTASGPCS